MIAVEEIHAELAQRCLQSGGWSFLARGGQPALEPTCFALLALRERASGQKLEPLLHQLNVYNEPVDALQQRLAALVKPDRISYTVTLAVVALGLECFTRGNVFVVSA